MQGIIFNNENRSPEASRLQHRLERERAARTEAEAIAERVTSELYDTVKELARSRSVLDETTDIVLITKVGGGAAYVNRAFREFFLIDDGHPLDDLDLSTCLTEDSRRRWVKEIQPDLEAKNIWRGELELLGPIGDELPVSLVAIGHTQHDGHLESISCIARDISEQRRLHAQLEHQAAHDPLTGLANRRHFYGYLDGALARARRATNSVVVVFIDLDDFKHINDRFGHDAGDDLLVTVADRLRAKCRVGDFVARFGGDEFAILCEQIADEPAASHVGARVMEAFDEPVRIGDLSVSVSASVGVAVGERDATEPHDLVRRADQAMYEAKRFGQGGYRVAACPSR